MPVEERLKIDGILVAPGFGELEGGRSSALCSKIKFLFGICLGMQMAIVNTQEMF
jgi:CTP synthase (UTP-ammonia lyase)